LTDIVEKNRYQIDDRNCWLTAIFE